MLTKVNDDLWIDLSQLTWLSANKDNDKCVYSLNQSNILYECTYKEGKKIQRALNKYYYNSYAIVAEINDNDKNELESRN